MSTTSRYLRHSGKSEDAYERHQRLLKDYLTIYNKEIRQDPILYKTELDILKENHKFIRDEEEQTDNLTWEQRIAKKYYDTLFKEYCLAELKYYKEGKFAMRWRTKDEVIKGKGQFICGSLRCDNDKQLESWEVNFAYKEDGERKNALVKLRLCPDCSEKLNYRKKQKKAKRRRIEEPRLDSQEREGMRERERSPESSERRKEKKRPRSPVKGKDPADMSTDEQVERFFRDLLQ